MLFLQRDLYCCSDIPLSFINVAQILAETQQDQILDDESEWS